MRAKNKRFKVKPLRRCARHRHIHLQRTDSRRSGCPPLCVSSDRETIYTLAKFPLDSSILYIYTRMTRATDDHFSPFARFFPIYVRESIGCAFTRQRCRTRSSKSKFASMDRSVVDRRERERERKHSDRLPR